MFFRVNNKISLTMVLQVYDMEYTAVGLALTHSNDTGTEKEGFKLALDRCLDALRFSTTEGWWGAGSFKMLTKYVDRLLFVCNNPYCSDQKTRSLHKSLFADPFKFLYKHCDYPVPSKTPLPEQICASCGKTEVYNYLDLDKNTRYLYGLAHVENLHGVKVPDKSPLCESCYKTVGWTEAFENIARRLSFLQKETKAEQKEPKVDPNTKVVNFSSHKIGDKWSVCVIFETDKSPTKYVKDKDYLSQEIIMATSLPLVY